MPPVASTVWIAYTRPRYMGDRGLPDVMTTLGSRTSIVAVCSSKRSFWSVIRSVNVYVPAVVGEPPSDVPTTSIPGGRLPEVTDSRYGAVPPVASTVWIA